MPDDRRAEELRAERDLLRQELLRADRESVLPGLLLGDRFVPGIRLDDQTWVLDPDVFTLEEVAALIDSRPLRFSTGGRLSEQQQQAWADADQDPLAAWQAWQTIAPETPGIDHPWVIVYASPVLERIAEDHLHAVTRAIELTRALSQIAAAVQAARRVLEDNSWRPNPGGLVPASLDRLLRLEATALWTRLRSPAVVELLEALDGDRRAVEPIGQVTNAWGPRHDPREPAWSRAARRLFGFLLLQAPAGVPARRGEKAMLHRALLAALDWHGHGDELGAGTLAEKTDRVRKVLPRDPRPLHSVR